MGMYRHDTTFPNKVLVCITGTDDNLKRAYYISKANHQLTRSPTTDTAEGVPFDEIEP
jgi:hypothetical protein